MSTLGPENSPEAQRCGPPLKDREVSKADQTEHQEKNFEVKPGSSTGRRRAKEMKTRDLRRKTGNLAVPSPSQASSFIAGRLRSSELLASCVCDATAVKPREGDVKGKKLLRFLALNSESQKTMEWRL